MTGFRSGRSGSWRRGAGARAAFRAIGRRSREGAPARAGKTIVFLRASPLARARITHPITAPRLWWKVAKKALTRPRRLQRKRRRKSGEELPWRLPRPMTGDEQMWADYRAFKAAGMLHEWLALYRHVLNLKPSSMEAVS